MTKDFNFLFKIILGAFFVVGGLNAASASEPVPTHTFAIGTNSFLIDGHPFQIRCGEMHAARVPREYWRNRLKMAKAMGLNTICAYLFWNEVEPEPGKFDWSGQADMEEFCRIAQEEGLWVILRPGPYSCAEWEMGGLPWWLLKDHDIQLRTRDPQFVDAARSYMAEVGKQLAPLQVTRGGPILMVQVENEYGSYGKDYHYMGDMRAAVMDANFEVPLFTCNGPDQLTNGYRTDLFPMVNFGSNPAKAFTALRKILPKGPLMCSEFYPGWFDTWGEPHHLGNTPQYLADLQYMLSHDESFSIYMVHGGTTFGLWSGADHPFKPDTSSYDYDAPISEAGWPTDKFYKTRALFSQYLLPLETLPDVPPTNAVISIPPVRAIECAPVFANLPKPIHDTTPQTMEEYNQGYGCIDYRTMLPAGPAASLDATSVHDFGFVYLDGKFIGVMDRRSTNFTVQLPERTKPARLDILVDAMGRVNYGVGLLTDRKGIHAPVKLDGKEIGGWEVFNLPLDEKTLKHLKYKKFKGEPANLAPAFWQATVKIEKPGDTFLDMRPWGKGVAWVNGHCLGRFWNIGPTQTMYVPGPWLKHGKNEIVIFDLTGPEDPVVAGLDQPILNELHPEKDFAQK